MDNKQLIAESTLTPELYFLVSKFLAAGPLQETAKVLVRELEEKKVLPKRTDWLGNEHEQTFEELEHKYAHIAPNHLLDICSRIGPILDRELTPSVPGIVSLLGAGRQSLLRTRDSIYRPRSLLDYCTRINGVSLPDSLVTKPIHNFQKVLFGREYGGPVRRKLLMPTSFYNKTKLLRRTVGHLSSVYCVLFDRTGRYIITGADDLLVKIWSAVDGRLLATLRGASAEITDIAINLDNTMLAAGSLDRILRVWDMQSTAPIAVLSGHTGMITSVNFCPSPRSDLKYLVTTSTDGSIAFWQYSTPRGQRVSFAPKPTQYHEKLRPGQAQMMCATFSPGGIFVAAGSADHHVRVYLMSEDGPKRILESEAYIDAVDSVQWSHRGLRFISGSKDGTAHIWTFESQQWKSVKLCMTERLSTCPEPEEGKKLKVTMVAWDCSDKYVITAVNDFTIKIWNSKTAKLHCVLRGHKDELYVLESNPKDEHVLLSAGHDGQVFIWDIERGIAVTHFINDIDGQGHGGVFDAKWSPDGTMIAATDSHGHILIFGLGVGPDKYKLLPIELFFHTDYRPLLRDGSHHVIDEQTQIMPHLMAPPFLVDADGNPHPARYQRFVPGRENCTSDQLIPNWHVGPEGYLVEDHNVSFAQIDRLIAALANRNSGAGGAAGAQGAPAAPSASGSGGGGNNPLGGNHSRIDRMIEALANRQGQDQAPDSNNRDANVAQHPPVPVSVSEAVGNILGNEPVTLSRLVGTRRPSELWNGPWPIPTNWNRSTEQQPPPGSISPLKYVRRVYVRPMRYAQLQNLKQSVYAAGQFELQEYKREMRRRPIMINTGTAATASQANVGRPRNTRSNGGVGGSSGGGATNGGRVVRRRQGAQSRPAAYRTRAVRGQEELDAPPPPEEDEEDEESSASSGDTSFSNVENLEESSEDSDTESSDYSDWVADTPGPNLEPPKRAKRKRLSRRRTFSDDSSDDTTEQATTSAGAAKAVRKNKHIIPPPAPNGEIPELYRPAEWLSEVIPRKAPYYPQMGDEVVYFRQGHQRYLDAVRTKKVYKLTQSSEPWNFRTLREHEMVRVIGIKYEIRPPRLCCLKLAMIDDDGNMTGTSFKIKYHDMPDVLDFLVLRQTFDMAVQRNWNIGDRFRCMIGDGWWMGEIESRHALSAEFPDSYFMYFRVRWDNGEYEYMSPWDMEPIDENRLPDEVGGAVPVLPEEIRATLYQPKSEEWHRGDRDGSCRRIINGLEQVMRLSIAEPFLAPVDLNIYPDYAYLIEYPIDLTTVKSRFENHFYRRITSAQFDVRYLATNAEKYNCSHTNIVKHARIITDLCLRIIRESNDIDVAGVYHQLVDGYHSSESENDNESDAVPSTSTGPSTSAAAARQRLSSTRRSNRIRSDGDWRSDCRQLLDMMWQRPDSVPFREPVDTIEFPDYLEIISTPMDLRTVKEDLLGGNYEDPLDFAKDVRLIFQNSKNYNTNKRSRIYSMTLRLSALFESHIKTVVSNWKAARRRANKSKGSSSARGSSGSPVKRTGPSTRRNQQQKSATRQQHTSDDDDDDDDGLEDRLRTNQRRIAAMARNGLTRSAIVASTSGSNRVTSSSSAHRRAGAAGTTVVGGASAARTDNQPTRSSRRNRASQELVEDHDEAEEHVSDDDEDEEEEEEDEDTSSSSRSSCSSDDDESSDDVGSSDNVSDGDSHDDDDEDDDDAHASRHRHRRGGGAHTRKKKQANDGDSEESYNPDNDRRSTRRGAKKRRKSNVKKKRQSKRKRTNKDADETETNGMQGTSRRKHAGAVGSSKSRRGAGGGTAGVLDVTNNTNTAPRRGTRRRLQSSEDDATTATATAPSQLDESTQDTVGQHTPKKKGRAGKAQANEGHSTGGIGANMLLQSPSRNTRHQFHNTTAGAANVGSGNGNSRRNPAENDHSYHLPVRNGRIAESDTDSREMTARPTRASVKRAILDWARGSDLEEAEESEEAEEILPTPTPTKVAGSSNNAARNYDGPSTSRAALGGGVSVIRQLRTNRNTRVGPMNDSDDDDDEDGSDNEPLASSQGLQSRSQNNHLPHDSNSSTRTTAPPHPLHLQRRMPSGGNVSVSHMTRSHATSTISSSLNATTSATSTAAASAPLAAHDHNYGNPGPSTALRNTRRGLSRHQCNADELDFSGDPLENSRLVIATARFRRRTSSYATNGSSTAAMVESVNTETNYVNTTRRRGRSRYSQENSQHEASLTDGADAEDDQPENEDGEEDVAASDEGTNGDSSSQDSEDASDSEDNQPLTSYVPGTRRTRNHHTQARRTSGRPTRTRHSDDSYVCDDDDDDDFVVDNRKHRGKQSSKKSRRRHDGGNVGVRRQRGSTRNQKRPRYNEQSDDDDYVGNNRKRRRDAADTNSNANAAAVGSSSATGATSSSTQRAAAAHEQEENTGEGGGGGLSTADSDEQMAISVSSRGRVRKITAKARGIFKE